MTIKCSKKSSTHFFYAGHRKDNVTLNGRGRYIRSHWEENFQLGLVEYTLDAQLKDFQPFSCMIWQNMMNHAIGAQHYLSNFHTDEFLLGGDD
ncbi:hypothetical protein REPUB_Repub16aG0108400 [Reevesia pubescens]